jgi:hypothetical protein
MQQTLSHPAHWLQAAWARLIGSAKRLAPAVAYDRDMVLTDQMEREFAAREFRRWR